jgi:hypothetical protein
VPASESALRKLNDRKVMLGALKDHVKGSQAQDTQADVGRSSLEAALCVIAKGTFAGSATIIRHIICFPPSEYAV